MPKIIRIPFLFMFRPLMVAGRKTMTSRFQRYGDPGDIFTVFDHTFVLISVRKVQVLDVVSQHFRAEGFKSQEAFMHCWRHLYPGRADDMYASVWLHEFRKQEGTFGPLEEPNPLRLMPAACGGEM